MFEVKEYVANHSDCKQGDNEFPFHQADECGVHSEWKEA